MSEVPFLCWVCEQPSPDGGAHHACIDHRRHGKRKRVTLPMCREMEARGYVATKRRGKLLRDAGLQVRYLPLKSRFKDNTPWQNSQTSTWAPGWALAMCDRFPRKMPHCERVAALVERARILVPLEARIVQEGLGPQLAKGYDPDELVAMLRGAA